MEVRRMAARQPRRQLQLSGFETGLLAAGFIATVTAIFFLGLFVGKQNASWHAPAEDRVARVPVDDFTRYKRPAPLEKPVREPKAAEVVASAATAPAPAAAGKPASSSLPSGPAGPAAAATASPAESAVAAGNTGAAPKDPSAKDAAAKDAAKAKELAAAKEAAAKKAKEAKEKEEKEKAESSTGKGYTVQILSTRKQAEAEALVQKLKSRGYGAYVKKIANGEDAWYRVRVGSYGAFSEAKGMADKCRRDLNLGQAFVSTE